MCTVWHRPVVCKKQCRNEVDMKQKIISVVMAAALIAGAGQPALPYAAIRTASAGTSIVSAALGASHSAAVTQNGDLYCWGSNEWFR